MITSLSITIIGIVAAIYILAAGISAWTALTSTPATRAEQVRIREREAFRLVMEQQERAILKMFPGPERARRGSVAPGQVRTVPS